MQGNFLFVRRATSIQSFDSAARHFGTYTLYSVDLKGICIRFQALIYAILRCVGGVEEKYVKDYGVLVDIL